MSFLIALIIAVLAFVLLVKLVFAGIAIAIAAVLALGAYFIAEKLIGKRG